MAAAEIVKYVDPDATGTGSGDDWTNAYTSMFAVEALNYNLTTQGGGDGSWLHVYCRSLSGTADSTAVTWSGWVTSATCYILLEAADGYQAKASGWDTSRYRVSLANSVAWNVGSGVDHFRMKGLQVEVTGSNAANQMPLYIGSKAAGNVIKLYNCRIRVAAASGNASSGIYFTDADLSGVEMWNTIVEIHPDNASTTVDGVYFNGTSLAMYNCNVYGFRYGIRDVAGSTVSVYDSAVLNNTDDFNGTFAAIDYCASDDGDGTNAVTEDGGGADWTGDFTDGSGGNWTLLSTSNLVGAGGMAGSGSFSDDIDGTVRGAAWDVGAHEYVSSGTSIALTGVSGTASVGTLALSAALALAGLAGTGAVGTLAPETAMAVSGIEAPAAPGTMSPEMAAVLAGIEAVDAAGTAGVSVTISIAGNEATGAVGTVARGGTDMALTGNEATAAVDDLSPGSTLPITGNEATGAVGTVTAQIGVGSDITIPITGVSANPAYQLSGVSATGAVGTVGPVEATDIILPITGVEATASVGDVVYLTLGGWAATGEIGDVAPTVAPPLTGNEATAAVGSVGQDRSVGLTGASANGLAGGWSGFSRPLTGVAGTGAVGTLQAGLSKSIKVFELGLTVGTGAVGSVVQSHDVALTGALGTGVAGHLDTLVAGDLVLPLTGVAGAGAAGGLSCLAPTPILIDVQPRKRIHDVQPKKRIIDVGRRRR